MTNEMEKNKMENEDTEDNFYLTYLESQAEQMAQEKK